LQLGEGTDRNRLHRDEGLAERMRNMAARPE
jgi:hypothetical protein